MEGKGSNLPNREKLELPEQSKLGEIQPLKLFSPWEHTTTLEEHMH